MAGEAFPVLYFSWTQFAGQERSLPVTCDMIRNVSPQVQQEIAEAICEDSSVSDRIILCHSPALLDQVDECIEANMNVSLILPRPGLIQNIVKKHSGKVMTFHSMSTVCQDLSAQARGLVVLPPKQNGKDQKSSTKPEWRATG